MRKLAIVISSLGPGGAERVAALQASWFAGKGYEVSLITLDGAVSDHYDLDHPGITRVRIQDNSPELLFSHIKNQNYDLTIDHIHWHLDHFEFFSMMGESNHRLLIFDHSTYFYPLYFQSKWPIFENRAAAYRNADAVSVLSRHSCQMFRQNIPASVFIPNPLSYESNSVSPVLESKTIIAVANWQRAEKRLDRVLEIFAGVLKTVHESRLILVGQLRQLELNDLINRYQLPTGRVEAVGQQEDVEPYYLRSRVLLHTSELEGFGLVLNEAGMHGLPRVAMDSTGLDEVIDHGVDGYLVKQGEKQAAVNYVVSLLSDDELCQKMSANVLSSIGRFSLETVGSRWEWLINLVSSASSGSEIEIAITADCRQQGVDEISIKRITEDYDAQLLRITRMFQAGGYTTFFSSGSLRQLRGRDFEKALKSRPAKILLEISELLETRYVAKLVRESGLFDSDWYLEQYADVKSSRIDPAEHYVKFGAMEGRNPSGEFDTLYYVDKHRDLILKNENPLLHFLETTGAETGVRKGQLGDIRNSEIGQKSSWTAEDRQWLDGFSDNASLLTLLEPGYLGIRRSANQFVEKQQMLFLRAGMDDATIDYYARLIVEVRPEKILIQGFPRSYLKLIRLLRKVLPETPVYCIYHGAFTKLGVLEERKCLQTLIELHREGVLQRIGLVKQGMAETLQTIGVDACFVMNFMAKIPAVPVQTDGVSVGIVGSEWAPLKPLYHQIAACKHLVYDELNIVGSEPSVMKFCELFKINAHHLGLLPHNEMAPFLAGNTINMYVTLSECAPMLPLESLAEGVPCLFGPNNHYFLDHPYLRSRLVVDIPDSETRIAEFARVAISERMKIITEYREYAKGYNVRAMQSFEAFLEGPGHE